MWTRQLKFRAWDGNRMLTPEKSTEGAGSASSVLLMDLRGKCSWNNPWGFEPEKPAGDLKIMQFIGVTDGTKWEDLTEQERDDWVRSGNMPSAWRGKEIYEGDIVSAVSQGYKGVFEVAWRPHGVPQYILWPAWQNKEFWSIHASEYKKGGQHIDVAGNVTADTVDAYIDDGLLVIGNIYEHPDLRPKPQM